MRSHTIFIGTIVWLYLANSANLQMLRNNLSRSADHADTRVTSTSGFFNKNRPMLSPLSAVVTDFGAAQYWEIFNAGEGGAW